MNRKKQGVSLGIANAIVIQILAISEPLWFKVLMLVICISIPLIIIYINGRDINHKEPATIISITVTLFYAIILTKEREVPLVIIVALLLSMISVPIIMIKNNGKYLKSVIQMTLISFIFIIIAIFLQMIIESI